MLATSALIPPRIQMAPPHSRPVQVGAQAHPPQPPLAPSITRVALPATAQTQPPPPSPASPIHRGLQPHPMGSTMQPRASIVVVPPCRLQVGRTASDFHRDAD